MSGSSFLLLLRLSLSLAIVLGLVWVAARVLRSRGALALRNPGSHLEVVERRPLGKSASVAVVRVGGKALLVGVTESRVELLRDCPELDLEEAADQDDVVLLGALDGPTERDGRAVPEPISATRRTGSLGHAVPRPPRMSLMDALRELTVRRASSPPPSS